MKISALIAELVKIKDDCGDVECFINTNEDAADVKLLTRAHILGGSGCIFAESDFFEDDSDLICYLGA